LINEIKHRSEQEIRQPEAERRNDNKPQQPIGVFTGVGLATNGVPSRITSRLP
jgi:hypothetical protein